MLGNSEIVTRVREQDHTLSKFLLLKNFTCMKYVKIQCKTPEIPQNTKLLAGYAPGDHAETAETGLRIKSQRYVRFKPKSSEGKFQIFKMNTTSIVALHTRTLCTVQSIIQKCQRSNGSLQVYCTKSVL